MSEKQYEHAKAGEGLNPHVKRSIILWCVISGVFVGVASLLDYFVVPMLCPHDPGVVTRVLVEKTIRVVFALFVVMGAINYFEVMSNGNLLGQILQSAVASSIFLSTVVYCVVKLLLWV